MNSFIKKIYVMAAAVLLSLSIYPTITKAANYELIDIPSNLFGDYEKINLENKKEIGKLYRAYNRNGAFASNTPDDSMILNVPSGYIYVVSYRNSRTGVSSRSNLTVVTPDKIGTNYEGSSGNLILTEPGKYEVSVYARHSGSTGGTSSRVDIYSYNGTEYQGYIDKFEALPHENKVDLSWSLNLNNDNDVLLFYTDGEKEEEFPVTQNSYTVKNLEPNTKYTFGLRLKTLTGQLSEMSIVQTKTLPGPDKPKEVKKLKAEATHDRVDLAWTLPDTNNFNHVNIYRDEKSSSIINKLIGENKVFPVVYADDDTKIFETNGTYFNDLTVKPETKYEYKITTETVEGMESKGIKATVKTLKKPKPDAPESEIEKQENGDYLVKWTSPTDGKVLIKIDGKDYKTVDAAAGSYLIPAKDMKYSFLGNPLVQLIAIDNEGDESSSTKPGPPGSTENGGSGAGFGEIEGIKAKDVLSGTMSFIKLLAPLIILGLIIYFVPRLIIVIKQSLNKNRNYNR